MAGTLSEREMALRLGVSLAGLQARRRAGLLPSARQDGRGRWRYDAALGAEEWKRNAPLRASRDEAVSQQVADWRAARTRHARALATAAEMRTRRLAGRFVDADEVRAEWQRVGTLARNRLLGLAPRIRQIVRDLTPAEVAQIDGLVREALEEVAVSGAAPARTPGLRRGAAPRSKRGGGRDEDGEAGRGRA